VTPDQYCQERAAASGSSFYYSFLFLEPRRRQAITALYAFCREVDDVVDDCPDAAVSRTKLAWWRGEVAALFEGRASHPGDPGAGGVAQALLPAAGTAAGESSTAMEMDLEQVRYADFKALHLYCYRVASVVGLLAAEIFGYRDRQTLKYAHDLGLAFQLTNIIRDVGEDARRGRIYLPQDEMARFGVSESDLLQAHYTDNFRQLMEFQVERAQNLYRQAFAQLPAADRKAQRAGLIMAAIYRATLDEIVRDRFRVLDQRISLPPLRKLWLAGKTWITA